MILDDPLALITFDTTVLETASNSSLRYHDKANANLNALILIKGLSKTTLTKFKQSKVRGIDVRMKELEVSFLEARSKYIEGLLVSW